MALAKFPSCTLTSTVATVGATAGLTSLSFGVESLTANTTYYFQVVASNTVSGSTQHNLWRSPLI